MCYANIKAKTTNIAHPEQQKAKKPGSMPMGDFPNCLAAREAEKACHVGTFSKLYQRAKLASPLLANRGKTERLASLC
jgi:hypothetical protein